MSPLRPAASSLFAGPVTIDLPATPVPGTSPIADKLPSDIDILAGGGTYNASEACLAAGGSSVVVAPITGVDEAGNLVIELISKRMPVVRRVATASRTRVSLIVPKSGTGETTTWTSRPVLDEAATFDTLQPMLQVDRRLVLASMTAKDAGLVRRLIEAHPGPTCLLLTADQCREPESTIPLMAQSELSWLNADELDLLTGHPSDVAIGICRLRERGVHSVIVTDGPRGAVGIVDGEWCHARSFQVIPTRNTSRCGDIGCGTFLAGIDRGESVHTALDAGMAAAAMHLIGMPRTGWESIAAFAAATPRNALIPRPRPTVSDAPRVRAAVAEAAPLAMGVLVGVGVTLATLPFVLG